MSEKGRPAATEAAKMLPEFGAAMWQASDRTLEAVRLTITSREAPAGTSPKEVIWRKNKSRLYHYLRETPPTKRTPIFFSMPLINRTYVIDLSPGNSLVQYLLSQGFDIYMYDWGVWGPEDRNITLANLLTSYLPRAVRAASRHANHKLTMLGYCIGGTLAAAFAGLYPEAPLENLVLFTAPIDFSNSGDYGTWVEKGKFPIEQIREALPYVPGEFLDFGSKMLNPLPSTIGTYVRLWDRLEDPTFDATGWQAMNRWVNEGVPFPATAYYEWITEFYQNNNLVKGLFEVDGKPIKLADIRLPLLNVAAAADNIAPRPTTAAILGLVSSKDKDELLLPGGHVGIVMGRAAKNNLWPKLAEWLGARD